MLGHVSVNCSNQQLLTHDGDDYGVDEDYGPFGLDDEPNDDLDQEDFAC